MLDGNMVFTPYDVAFRLTFSDVLCTNAVSFPWTLSQSKILTTRWVQMPRLMPKQLFRDIGPQDVPSIFRLPKTLLKSN